MAKVRSWHILNTMVESSALIELAMRRLNAVAAGNGIQPAEIELLGGSVSNYDIHGELTLNLKTLVKSNRQTGILKPTANMASCLTFAALAKAAREAAQSAGNWVEAVQAALKENNIELWGYAGEIAVPALIRRFFATEACTSCQGQSRMSCMACSAKGARICLGCNRTGRISCRHCHGAGHAASDPQAPCPVCSGQRTENCPQCQGNGTVSCSSCNGKGSVSCQDCRGSGRLTESVEISYSAEATFGLAGNPDLPQGLVRSIDRGGIGNLAKGHATIEINGADTAGMTAIVSMTAHLPYGEAKFRILGKMVEAQLLGHKGAIFGVPAFLDSAIADGLAGLKSAAQGAGGNGRFDAILHYRVLREALILVLTQPKASDSLLLRSYPVGLSRKLAGEIIALSRKALATQSRQARWLASFAVIALYSVICWAYFNGPLRPAIRHMISGDSLDALDFIFPLIGTSALWAATQAAQDHVLMRKLAVGKAKRLSNVRLGGSFKIYAGVLLVIWAGLLISGIHAPDWMKMLKIKYEAGILFE